MSKHENTLHGSAICDKLATRNCGNPYSQDDQCHTMQCCLHSAILNQNTLRCVCTASSA
ncbi:hypothetical protein K450DRAFT_249897 [Umbelopsis ramanniana AG]|uniref:Uncharacterized protein n=1 Tax=Umbelopsis ramanniana AG TaxID=1314678 RepID=A0AAD5HBF4_UMBRA|nr:uncharacterized protein K450DRAFT_249897 [Umbelopsis ramanniana AG]KAI8577922.1 hypothetical protein K450DRAFT_249897 [Umbelopsis ramanniana AG]